MDITDIKRIVAVSLVDERTVRRYAAGKAVRAASRDRIERAVALIKAHPEIWMVP